MLLRLAAAACLFACSPAPHSDPCLTAVGDPTQDLALQPLTVDGAGHLQPLHDGDPVLLQKPPQGGYVLYAGAAARNLLPCGATATAYLIDRATGNALTNLDQRRVDFTSPSGDYWQTTQPYVQTPNIPACPDALHVGVAGRDATLHVDVVDAQSRRASVEVRVTATCSDAACACICGPDPSHC